MECSAVWAIGIWTREWQYRKLVMSYYYTLRSSYIAFQPVLRVYDHVVCVWDFIVRRSGYMSRMFLSVAIRVCYMHEICVSFAHAPTIIITPCDLKLLKLCTQYVINNISVDKMEGFMGDSFHRNWEGEKEKLTIYPGRYLWIGGFANHSGQETAEQFPHPPQALFCRSVGSPPSHASFIHCCVTWKKKFAFFFNRSSHHQVIRVYKIKTSFYNCTWWWWTFSFAILYYWVCSLCYSTTTTTTTIRSESVSFNWSL